jgi:hypothetical protein
MDMIRPLEARGPLTRRGIYRSESARVSEVSFIVYSNLFHLV